MNLELAMALCAVLSTVGSGAYVVYRIGQMSEKLVHMETTLKEHTNTRERLSALEAVVFRPREAA